MFQDSHYPHLSAEAESVGGHQSMLGSLYQPQMSSQMSFGPCKMALFAYSRCHCFTVNTLQETLVDRSSALAASQSAGDPGTLLDTFQT